MILPPFFGLYSKYDESFIRNVIINYINADIISYTAPTENVLLTYKTVDILSHNTLFPVADISYINTDILSVPIKKTTTNISFISCDFLFYELPPSLPSGIDFFVARDKDSLAILNWDAPFDGKTPIIKYNIFYKKIDEDDWILTPNFSTDTFRQIILENNFEYEFKIEAVNKIGTGEFTISNSVIPSGGTDFDCDIISYVTFDTINIFDTRSIACFSNQQLNVTAGNNQINPWISSAFAISFPGEPFTIDNPPHVGSISYPHTNIPRSKLYSWSLINNFTISFWFKPDDNPLFTRTLLSATSDNTNNSWKISYSNNSIIFSSGNKNNMQNIISATNLNIPTDSFTHLALCRSNNYISLFINGQEKSEIFNKNNITIDSNFLIVGGYGPNYDYSSNNNWGIIIEPFKGSMAEIFLSRSALYRGNFTPPLINRDISNLDCEDCAKLPAPTNLQVIYIDN
jgi:hypothetical protein